MAVSYSGLYPQVTQFENLLDAYRKAARGKRSQPQLDELGRLLGGWRKKESTQGRP
ncbi:MAG: hypothetical protein KDJ99_33475 [Candidatus Competibacteraceae bacterium]|nr:hypothetical protein [Candidatus Competibacteraceae bacterium]